MLSGLIFHRAYLPQRTAICVPLLLGVRAFVREHRR